MNRRKSLKTPQLLLTKNTFLRKASLKCVIASYKLNVLCTARLWCLHQNQTRVYAGIKKIFPAMFQKVLRLFRFRRYLL